MKKRPSRVLLALAQMTPRLGDLKRNASQVESLALKARDSGACLAVFPELALTGYFLKDLVPDVALTEGSPVLASLAKLSKDLDLVVGGVFEDKAHRFYNAAFFFHQGRLKGIHRKIYLPTYGMFDEGRYFAAGNELSVFRGRAGAFTCLLCEDAWHGVLPLAAALQGAGLLVIPSSSPARGLEKPGLGIARTWQTLNRAWAMANSLHVAYCNRVGFEEGVGFWGGSELVGPDGIPKAQAPMHKEKLLLAEFDMGEARRTRSAAPILRDEKLDLDARLFAGLAGWELKAKAGRKK